MSMNPMIPGVFIEEVPNRVRTIKGVSTSITAFVGTARRGPISEPVKIRSYADFDRFFGGQSIDHPLSYAVRDFFLNGGSDAIIVRLVSGGRPARLELGGLQLEASSPGEWGNQLHASIDCNGIASKNAASYAPYDIEDLFNLTIVEKEQGRIVAIEIFQCVSLKDGPRRVDLVLNQESSLARMKPVLLACSQSKPADVAESAFTDGASGGTPSASDYVGSEAQKSGMYALEKVDLFNLLCIPPHSPGGNTEASVYQQAMSYCAKRGAMLIVDSPVEWGAQIDSAVVEAAAGLPALGLTGPDARNAALYFPRIVQADPLRDGRLFAFVACGAIAGLIARIDSARGVWKAPAGTEASINGIHSLQVDLSDAENADLNRLGINCLRSFPNAGHVSWGARTLAGSDQHADTYKFLPVRRMADFIEESVSRGIQFAIFEPNDEVLWKNIRLAVGAFMQALYRQGAFSGQTANDAFFVKVDSETTTQDDINLGHVNLLVGFAPLKPAEFVVINIRQIAGQSNF